MKKFFLFPIAILLLQLNAQAQPPGNDNCSGARELIYANQFTLANQTIAGATFSYTNTTGPVSGHDVWYKFTTLRDGDFELRTLGNNLTTYIYTQGFGGFTCSSGSSSTAVQFEAFGGLGYGVPGNSTIFIRVTDGSSNPASTINTAPFTIQLTGTAVSNTLNDDCTGSPVPYRAKEVLYNAGLYNENNYYSTPSSTPVNACNGGNAGTADDDTWYRFSIPTSQAVGHGTFVQVNSISNKDMAVILYDNCGDIVPLACANYSTGVSEIIQKRLGAQPGNSYYLRVFTTENNSDPVGRLNNFDIIVMDTVIAVNDESCSSMNITYGGAPIATTTKGASYSNLIPRDINCSTDASGVPKPAGGTGLEGDVWYSFPQPSASTNAMVIRVTATDGFSNPVFFVYTGTDCNNLSQIGCGNATAGVNETLRLRDIVPGSPGMRYYVRVHQFNNQVMPFTIQAKDTIIAVNDVCTGAINIPFGTNLTGQNNLNMTGPITLQTPCTGPAGYPEDDSWYRFVPPGTIATVSTNHSFSNRNPVLIVYSVNTAFNCRNGVGGGGITQIACANTGGLNTELLLLTGLTAGNEYLIRVYDQNIGPSENFSIYAGTGPLPVSLSNFTGEHNASVNVLRWTTLTEINNAAFELQRSTNGVDFTPIATLNSKAAGGNSNALINYDFTDRTPAPGINYYRLKQVDKDAKATYSSIVQLKGIVGKMLTLLGVYPNPASNAISINISSPVQQPIILIVTDIAGKIVKQQTAALPAGEKTFSMDVQALGAGSYFVKAICQDGCQSQYLRFNKN